jgi:hypothetical protein
MNVRGAYPFHWHLVGNATGQLATDNSVYRYGELAVRVATCTSKANPAPMSCWCAQQLQRPCCFMKPQLPPAAAAPCRSPCRSFFRCLTIHATSNLRVQNNVAFDITGHCFYLEVSGWVGAAAGCWAGCWRQLRASMPACQHASMPALQQMLSCRATASPLPALPPCSWPLACC